MAKVSRDELLARIGDLVRASQVSADKFDDVASDVMGINRTDHRVMDVVERLGPIPAGKLAEITDLSPAAMTVALDRLESAGLARRVPDPTDRRRVLVEVTPAAREAAWKIYGPMQEAFIKLMRPYSVADLELLLGYLEKGEEISAEQLERVKRMRS